MSVPIRTIEAAIAKFAPLENAEAWDNTGVLIDTMGSDSGKNVLLTIDMTVDVVEECIRKNINCVVAYHPVIFTGLKQITDAKYIKCIKHGISVYCPHTQLDSLMNTWIEKLLAGCASLEEAAAMLKNMAGMSTIRVVRGGAPIQRIIAGVGATFKNIDFSNTLVITGEMGHHTMLECKRRGNSAIIMEHSNSERIFLGELRRMMLQDATLADYNIMLSEADKDPVEFL